MDDFGIDPSDTMAGRDVIPQLERLRVKAVGRVRGFLLHKIADLRKPRTNVQMVQEHVLLRLKFVRRLAEGWWQVVHSAVVGEGRWATCRIVRMLASLFVC